MQYIFFLAFIVNQFGIESGKSSIFNIWIFASAKRLKSYTLHLVCSFYTVKLVTIVIIKCEENFVVSHLNPFVKNQLLQAAFRKRENAVTPD